MTTTRPPKTRLLVIAVPSKYPDTTVVRRKDMAVAYTLTILSAYLNMTEITNPYDVLVSTKTYVVAVHPAKNEAAMPPPPAAAAAADDDAAADDAAAADAGDADDDAVATAAAAAAKGGAGPK